MRSWSPFPFVRIVVFFIAGILWAIYWPDSISTTTATLTFGVLSSIFIVIVFLRSKGKASFFNPGFIGLCTLVLLGYVQVHHNTASSRPNHIINSRDTIEFYRATIISQKQERENSWKVEAHVNWVQVKNGIWIERSGKVLLYFAKNDFPKSFHYGDQLFIKGAPALVNSPLNPDEFDYRQFLSYRGIYYQHFLKSGAVIVTGHHAPNKLVEYSIWAREWASEVIKSNVAGLQEQATTSALVLGLMDGIDSELIGAYAATGSLHVLSVSGLHVGIIYWLLLIVFKPLDKSTSGKWTLAILSILALWSYAFVTGLSPSVLRAVTMFSFVSIAKPWNQRTNIYNTLSISAFCLLLYDPYLIMSVGFQLSYIAVVGIVYLQPFFLQLWEPKRWVVANIWQILSVSVAAQLATFPLGLFYFHQFPVYFLLSNLFVIPVSFVVLILGIALISFGTMPFVSSLIGFIVTWSVKLLNGGVIVLEQLPFSLIENVAITTVQCWVLLLLVIFAILLFEYRSYTAGILASVCMVLFSVIQWNSYLANIRETQLVVYNVKGHRALDIIQDGDAFFFSDSLLAADKAKISYHVQPYRIKCGVNKITTESKDCAAHFQGCRVMAWKGMLILQLLDRDFQIPNYVHPDYVIISNNAVGKSVDISRFKSSVVILDSSNSFYFAERILKEARQENVKFHSVLHQGAFIVKLFGDETHRISSQESGWNNNP